MTPHLTDIEQLAAADGSLATERMTHATTCDACRAGVADARAFLGRIAADEVPEPSPLFWDHFAARVRLATRSDAPASRSLSTWRAWISLAATAATVVFAVWIVRQPQPATSLPTSTALMTSASSGAAQADADGPGDTVSWESVLAMPHDLGVEDLLDGGDAGVSLDDLTQAERAVFVRLLSEEMDVLQ